MNRKILDAKPRPYSKHHQGRYLAPISEDRDRSLAELWGVKPVYTGKVILRKAVK